jgi:hypothetical protein
VDCRAILEAMAKGKVPASAENRVHVTPPVYVRKPHHNAIFLLHSENYFNVLNSRVLNYCKAFGTEI